MSSFTKERRKIEGIKDELEKLKEQANDVIAERNFALKQLKEKFGCSTVEEVEFLIEEMEEVNKTKTVEIASKTQKFIDELKLKGFIK